MWYGVGLSHRRTREFNRRLNIMYKIIFKLKRVNFWYGFKIPFLNRYIYIEDNGDVILGSYPHTEN